MAVVVPRSNIKVVRIGSYEVSFPVVTTTKANNLYILQTITPPSYFIFDATDSTFSTEYIPLGSAVTNWQCFVIIPAGKTAQLYVFQSFDGITDGFVQVHTVPVQSDPVAGNLRSLLDDNIVLPYIKIRLDISPADSVKLGMVLVS